MWPFHRLHQLTNQELLPLPLIHTHSLVQAFMAYAGGVFTPDHDCVTTANGPYSPPSQKDCATEVDHAMLLVGYGTDSATGLHYWCVCVCACGVRRLNPSSTQPNPNPGPGPKCTITPQRRIIKNTWSATWGEGGYMRIQRNSALAPCGTACLSAFPVAAVQGFATTDAGTWGDDDVVEEGKDQTTAQKIVETIKDITNRAAAALDEAGEAIQVCLPSGFGWLVGGVKKIACRCIYPSIHPFIHSDPSHTHTLNSPKTTNIQSASAKLKTLDIRILAVAITFSAVFSLAFFYYCCCVRRWRRQRRVRLELERERGRWV